MAHSRSTEHYQLPLYDGTDIINPLTDFNNANEAIDEALYNANSTALEAKNKADGVVIDVEQYDTRINNIDAKADTAIAESASAKSDVTIINSTVATLQGTVSTQSSDIETLKSDMITANGDITDIKDDIATINDNLFDALNSVATTLSTNINAGVGFFKHNSKVGQIILESVWKPSLAEYLAVGDEVFIPVFRVAGNPFNLPLSTLADGYTNKKLIGILNALVAVNGANTVRPYGMSIYAGYESGDRTVFFTHAPNTFIAAYTIEQFNATFMFAK